MGVQSGGTELCELTLSQLSEKDPQLVSKTCLVAWKKYVATGIRIVELY